jgi:hypothetical protein
LAARSRYSLSFFLQGPHGGPDGRFRLVVLHFAEDFRRETVARMAAEALRLLAVQFHSVPWHSGQ